MLIVERVISPYPLKTDKDAEELFKEDRSFVFAINAPLYWWVDVDGIKYGFDLSDFSENEITEIPLSTNVKGMLCLSYRNIVEVCEDYIQGFYKYLKRPYQFPNEREWKDFCETLLDIRGIRDLLEDE